MHSRGDNAEKIPSEEEFHAAFVARVLGSMGPTEVSRKYGVKITTAQEWIKKGRMPRVYEFLKMAQGDAREAAFMAFGDAPKAGKRFKFKGMPETVIKPYSTRDELKRYKLSFQKVVSFEPVKLFRNLAAGYGGGENYEVMEEAYIKGVPKGGWTVAQVRGDSMVDTLRDGDFVLLKDFPAPGYVLPRIESPEEKVSLERWQKDTKIKDKDIVVVDLDQPEGKTLKRVKYDTRRGVDNWKMLIAADNPQGWQDAWQVAVGDKVTFYGTLMGLCEPE